MNEQQHSSPGKPAYEIVRFQINIPERVALAFAKGLEVKSSQPGYSDQVLYTLVGNRRMYVAPIVADKIAELGIQKGEEFMVGKKEVRDGQKRSIRWFVEPIVPEPETPLARDLRDSIPIAQAVRSGADPHAATESARAARKPAPQEPPNSFPPEASESTKPDARQPKEGGRPAAARDATMPSGSPNGSAGTSNGTAPRIPPTKIPYDVAFAQVLDWMGEALRTRNEQWTDQARQNFVSTVLIGAQREGWICPWQGWRERP